MHHRPQPTGFTLIEVALVVIIAGVLLGALAGSYAVYLQSAHAKAVRTNMETVETAIKEFLAVNGRLPCPARITDAPDSATFGVEAAVDCDGPGAAGAGQGAAVAGTFESPAPGAATPTRVRIGMVPVRTLNLPDQYSQDSWKNRYRYAVTEGLATSGSYDPNNGAVSIIDSAGNPALRDAAGNPAFAHYVLISSGPDSVGAYSNSGNTTVACPAAGAAAPLDRENCNEDAIFRKTSAVSTPTGAKHYDDFLTFASSATLQETDCGDHGMLHGINFVGNKDANGCLTDMRIYDNDMVGIGLATGVNSKSPLQIASATSFHLSLSGGVPSIYFNPSSTGNINGTTDGTQTFDGIVGLSVVNGHYGTLAGDMNIITQSGAAGNSNAINFITPTNDAGAYATRMTVTKAGNVGVGTVGPTSALEISRTGAANSTIRLTNLGTGFSSLEFDTAEGDYIGGNYAVINLSNAGLLEINNGAGNIAITGGNVGIGTAAPGAKLEVNGAVNATAFNYTSDERLKTNITTLDDSLNKILQLRGVSFHWKKDGTPGIGLIAQEVEKVYPELVTTNSSTGYKSVQYGNLIGPVIEAIKEQQKETEDLRSENEALRNKLEILEQKLDALSTPSK